MKRNPPAPGPDKKSTRKERKDKLAASLRENLLRRKEQARIRKGGDAADKATAPASVDLEVEDVVHDTEADTKAVT